MANLVARGFFVLLWGVLSWGWLLVWNRTQNFPELLMGLMSHTQLCRRQGHRTVTHLTITDKLSSTEIYKIATPKQYWNSHKFVYEVVITWIQCFTLSFLLHQQLTTSNYSPKLIILSFWWDHRGADAKTRALVTELSSFLFVIITDSSA